MEDLLMMVVILAFISIATTIIMATLMIFVIVANSFNTNRTIKACSPVYQEAKARKRENKLDRKITRKLNRKAFYLKVSKGVMSIQIFCLKSLVSIKSKRDAKKYAKENHIRQEFIDMVNEDKARVDKDRRRECRAAKEVDFNYVIYSLNAELYPQDKEYKRERPYTIKSLVYQNKHGQYIVADSYIVGDHGAVFNLSEFCELKESVAKEVDQYLFNYDVLNIINERIGNDKGFGRVTDSDDELVFSHIKRGLDGFEKDAIQATFVFKVPVLKSELKIMADLYNPNISHDYAEREVAAGIVLENEVEVSETIEDVIDVEECKMEAVKTIDTELIAQMVELTKDLVTGAPRIKFNESTLEFEPIVRTVDEIQEAVNSAIGHNKNVVDNIIAITAVNGQATKRYNDDLHVIEEIHMMNEEEAKEIVSSIEFAVVDEDIRNLKVEPRKVSKREEFNTMLSRIQKGEVVEELLCDQSEAVGCIGTNFSQGLKTGESRKLTQEELDELDTIKSFYC